MFAVTDNCLRIRESKEFPGDNDDDDASVNRLLRVIAVRYNDKKSSLFSTAAAAAHVLACLWIPRDKKQRITFSNSKESHCRRRM